MSADYTLASTEEIIDEARNGNMFILVDDESAQNEGDLIIPAQMATPKAISFMATHAKGLVCLALSRMRVEQLGLRALSPGNNSRHSSAFTVSIEAREGVSTGISAADRARTIAVAIDNSRGKADIVSPGHVFPLTARDGGVLVRAGHTEASVDIARLAGLNPSAVICEIMNDEGEMARMDELVQLAQKHNLKIGSISDLIAYRRRFDSFIERISENEFESEYGGLFKACVYRNTIDQSETLVITKGEISADKPTLVRMHAISPLYDMLGKLGQRAHVLSRALQAIAKEGVGVVVVLTPARETLISQAVTASSPKPEMDLRAYGIGAQILADLGVHDMILLTDSHHNLVALEGYNLSIIEERPFSYYGF